MSAFETIDDVVLALQEFADAHLPEPQFTKVAWTGDGTYTAIVRHSRGSEAGDVSVDLSGDVPELQVGDDVHVEHLAVRYDSHGNEVYLDAIYTPQLHEADYPLSAVLERETIGTLDAPETLQEED